MHPHPPHYTAAVEWARRQLAPGSRAVLLDTETTGLAPPHCQVIEIAVIDINGNVLLNSLIQPQGPIPAPATAIHGITDQAVAEAPKFKEIYPAICAVLSDRPVLIYNAPFDCQALNYTAKLHQLPPLSLQALCLMRWYSQWVGQWHPQRGQYRYHPLHGGHRALADCQAALERLRRMAALDRNDSY